MRSESCCCHCLDLYDVMCYVVWFCFFFFKQKTAYEMRISDWSSDVCSSDLRAANATPMANTMRYRRLMSMPKELIISRLLAPARIIMPSRVRPSTQIGRASCRERVCQYV